VPHDTIGRHHAPHAPQVPDGSDAAVSVSRLEVAQAELDNERAAHRRELRRKAREQQEVRRRGHQGSARLGITGSFLVYHSQQQPQLE